MSARIVTEDVSFLWDGVSQRLTRGQMLDVTPGGALEDAIGSENLRPPGPIAPAPADPELPVKPAAPAAKPDEDKQEEPPEATPKKTAQATAKLAGTEGKESGS
jgi:hypothetical protein